MKPDTFDSITIHTVTVKTQNNYHNHLNPHLPPPFFPYCPLNFWPSTSSPYTFIFSLILSISSFRQTKRNVKSGEIFGIKKNEISLLLNFCKCLIYPSFHLFLSSCSNSPQSINSIYIYTYIHWGVAEVTTPFSRLLHFIFNTYLIMLSV